MEAFIRRGKGTEKITTILTVIVAVIRVRLDFAWWCRNGAFWVKHVTVHFFSWFDSRECPGCSTCSSHRRVKSTGGLFAWCALEVGSEKFVCFLVSMDFVRERLPSYLDTRSWVIHIVYILFYWNGLPGKKGLSCEIWNIISGTQNRHKALRIRLATKYFFLNLVKR